MKKFLWISVMLLVVFGSLSGCAAPQTEVTPTAVLTEEIVATATEIISEPSPEVAQSVIEETAAVETRTVVDSRGVIVEIPADPQRIVTVSDALVEEVMTVLGVQDRLIGIGSTCLVRDFTYDYETVSSEKFSYTGGMNPANYLNPNMIDLPRFVEPGTEMNFETLASLEPDVVIIDVGACTLDWCDNAELMQQGLDRLESLGIPTIVLMGPNSGGTLSVDALSSEVRILGEVFNQQEKAEKTGRLPGRFHPIGCKSYSGYP